MTIDDVIVIGAGITGIGAAYYLQENGLSYKILEQNDDLGGIWNTQRWHGARCDSAIVKYSFSFKPYLSETYLKNRDQIHQYLHDVADEFGIIDKIHFQTTVTEIRFDSNKKIWTVQTNQGTFYSRYVLNGNGYFSNPYIPTFPGTDAFQGEIIHTFQLDKHQTFHDKKMVIVGSGSTAFCLAPPLSDVAQSVTLLQRSPSYIYEIENPVGWLIRSLQAMYKKGVRFPLSVFRYCAQLKADIVFLLFRKFPKFGRWFFKRFWVAAVGEQKFQEHFHPKYQPWEQRISLALGLRKALASGKVVMKTGEIDRFNASSIVLKNQETIPCDVCILATGFDLNFFKFKIYIDDQLIDMTKINFYKGVIVGGIPNYFQPTGVLHSSWTQRSEIASKYAIKIIKYMQKRGYQSFLFDRQEIEYTPSLNSSYIMRHHNIQPREHGSFRIPSFDHALSYWFHPSEYHFS